MAVDIMGFRKKSLIRRHWPLLIMAALTGGVLYYLIPSRTNGVREPHLGEMAAGEGIRLRDIHYIQDDSDEGMKWVLDAKEVTFSNDHNTMAFREFHLRFEPQAKPWFQMKGNQGEYSRGTGDIRLWGDLEGTSQDGYRMTTDRLWINEKTRQVRTDGRVAISGPLFSVIGTGLFADLTGQRIEILRDVTTILRQEAWEQ